MTITHRTLATAVAGVVVASGLAGAGAAIAADTGADAAGTCVRQEAHVAKAEDALARVTAVFTRTKRAVAHAKDDLADAHGSEKAAAQRALARAKAAKAEAATVKKAQQVRLAKAQQRLEQCQAAQPPATDPTDPTDPADPSGGTDSTGTDTPAV